MTKDLLNGIAVTCLLALSMHLPVIGFFFVVFLPLPIVYYRLKFGRRIGAIIPLSAVAAVAIVGRAKFAQFGFLAEFLVIGFFIGENAAKKFSIEKTVLTSAGAVLIAFLISVFFYSSINGIDLISETALSIEAYLEKIIFTNEGLILPKENAALIKAKLPEISNMLVFIIPGIVMANALLTSWIYSLTAKAFFMAKNIGNFEFGPLNQWKAPEFLVWVAIGTGFFMFIPVPLISVIGLNALPILFVVYFFQGIAIVSFYFEKKKLPKALRIVLYFFIAIQQLLVFLIIGIGFFDVWLDIRKLHTKTSEEN